MSALDKVDKRCKPIPIGERFGKLTVLSDYGKVGKERHVNVRCDCGFEGHKRLSHLRAGDTTQCRSCSVNRNVIGQRFGRLVVLSELRTGTGSHNRLTCECDCGKVRDYSKTLVTDGNTRSCGCYRNEVSRRRLIAQTTTHGMYGSDEHTILTGMITRCENKKDYAYLNYGARGIYVCERWRHSLENFVADMGLRPSKKHSIDRIDNNGPYSPENCRWATMKEQCRNKRTNRWVNCEGEKLCLVDAAKKYGVSTMTIYRRIHSGQLSDW